MSTASSESALALSVGPVEESKKAPSQEVAAGRPCSKMASADVLRARGQEQSAAQIAQLLSDMRLSCSVDPPARAPAGLALAQHPFGAQSLSCPHPSQPPMPPAPAAAPRAQEPVAPLPDTSAHFAWRGAEARPAPRQQPAALLAIPPQSAVRPPSPDSRYLTTNWAAHDEVEEELSFMMTEQAAITDAGPRHDLSYIS